MLVYFESLKMYNEFNAIRDELFTIIRKYKPDGLIVQPEKTEIRLWNGTEILDEQLKPSKIDYLGFVTDGRMIQLREKSLFNYYTRAYRKVNNRERYRILHKKTWSETIAL